MDKFGQSLSESRLQELLRPESAQGATSLSHVAATLDLENGSLEAGNVAPTTCDEFVDVAVAPELQRAYATCNGTGALAIFNTSSGLALDSILVGQDPTDVVYDAVDSLVFVAVNGSDTLVTLEGANHSVINRTPVDGGPNSIAYDPLESAVYVTSYSLGTLIEVATRNQTVLRDVSLGPGSAPNAVCFDQGNGDLYVSESGLGRVGVLSSASGSAVANVSIVGDPIAVACDPSHGIVYVGSADLKNDTGLVTFVSTSNNSTLRSVATVPWPYSIVAPPSMGRIYVATPGTNSVAILNSSDGARIVSVPVGLGSGGLAYDNSTADLYVANYNSNDIAVLNTTQNVVTKYLALNTGPFGLAWNGFARSLEVTNQFAGDVQSINGLSDETVGDSTISYDLAGIAVDPTTGASFVACTPCNRVFDLNSSLVDSGSTAVGSWPSGVAYDPSNDNFYVANSLSNNVSFGSATSFGSVSTISIPGPELGGGFPKDIAFDPSNADLYVSVEGCICGDIPGNVTVINGSSNLVSRYVQDWAQPGPAAMTVGPNHTLFLTDDYGNRLWVFNTSSWTVIAMIPVGSSPEGVVLDPGNGLVYVSNEYSNNVTVIDASTYRVVQSIPVGIRPYGVAYDPLSGEVYVANEGSGTLSIIAENQSFSVAFSETGLPLETSWSIRLGGTLSSSSNNTIDIRTTNGTYDYTITDVGGWHQSTLPYSGTLTVAGDNIVEPTLRFSEVTYLVNFTESGLQRGQNWTVTLNASVVTSSTSVVTFTEPNGTYHFAVNTTSDWSSSPNTGVVTVNDSGVNKSIVFSHTMVSLVISVSWVNVSVANGCGSSATFEVTVQFFGNVTGGVPPYAYNWSFGPGTAGSNSQNPRHVYMANASAVASVSVTDSLNDRGSRIVNLSWPSSFCGGKSGPVPYLWTVLGATVGVSALLVIAAILVIRRRPGSPPTG